MAQQGGQQRNDRYDNYVPVAERIEQFYTRYPDGRICTMILEHDRESGFVLIRAEVFRHADDAQPAATGHAYEYKDAGYVQKTSYIETGETSAVGRALAFLNFETKRGIASREEMEKVARMNRQETAASATRAREASTTAGEASISATAQTPPPARPTSAPLRETSAATPAPTATAREAVGMTKQAARRAAPAEDADALATDAQKEDILALLETLRPDDRRAQRKLLTDMTGKRSRDDLTHTEARRFIAELKKGEV